MKNQWQAKRIGDLCEVIAGQSPEGKFYNSEGKGMAFYQGKKDFGEKVIETPTTWTTHTTKIAREGDILMSVRAPVGPVNFATDEICIGRGLAAIRSGAELNREFLFYQLLHLQPEIAGKEGAVFASINKSEIEALPLTFVPLPEQKRIVGILDEAFAGLATATANAEKNHQNARALFQSVLSQSVVGEITKKWRSSSEAAAISAESDLKKLVRQIAETERKPFRGEEIKAQDAIIKILPKEWCHASIEQLFNLIDYRGKTASKSNSGHRLITARNIKMGYLSDEPVTYILKEQYKKWMVRGFPKPGDIFFVTEGHTMGFVALNTRTDDFALAQRTITLQPPIPFETRFFFYFMLSEPFQKLVKLNATGAAAVGMKASRFRSLPLAFPSFTEQKIIADKLDELRAETHRLENIYQRKLATLEALKKSLLHHAFTGQL